MSDQSVTRRRIITATLLVFVVALGLRLAHLLLLRSSFEGTDLFSIPLVDAEHHWNEAMAILDGEPPLRDGVPWKGPGYSYFLAGLAMFSGRSVGSVRWPLAILGSLNCALLVLLARRVLDLRWSLAAGMLAALNGVLIVYDTEPYQPTLLITLNLGALLLLSRKRERSFELALAGVLLGLACLVHPSYLLPAALIVLWVFRRGWGKAIVLACAIVATIAPLTLSNLIRHKEPVLISWNGGANVYVGNHPTFDQRAANATVAWGRILQAPQDAGMDSVAERDRLYYRLSIRRALEYPVATTRVLAEKAVVFFSPVEYASNFRIYDLRKRSPVLAPLLWRWGPVGFPFGLWGPAALIGIALLLRRRAGPVHLLALWTLGVLLTNLLVFNTARYRAPVVFLGCIFVAGALASAWRLRIEGRWPPLIRGVAVFALLAALLALTAVPQEQLPPPYEWHQAVALSRNNDFEAAATWAERALERDPRSPWLLASVSRLYGHWEQRERQRELLHRLLALPDVEPDSVDAAHGQLAASYFAQGRFDESRAELLNALAVGVDDTEWHGYPHYSLGIGPIRWCVLQLRLAEVELQRGALVAARESMHTVQQACPASQRFRRGLETLNRISESDRFSVPR